MPGLHLLPLLQRRAAVGPEAACATVAPRSGAPFCLRVEAEAASLPSVGAKAASPIFTFRTRSAGVAAIPGSSVEHNKFCVSVHFRNCAPDAYPDALAATEAVVSSHGEELLITRGRKVRATPPLTPPARALRTARGGGGRGPRERATAPWSRQPSRPLSPPHARHLPAGRFWRCGHV